MARLNTYMMARGDALHSMLFLKRCCKQMLIECLLKWLPQHSHTEAHNDDE